jgi:hypothetical protein
LAVCIVAAAGIPDAAASEIDLPSVDIRSQRTETNRLGPDADVRPVLPAAERGEEIFLFPGLAGTEKPVFREKKNALFSVGYGIYDRLATSLVFANRFGAFSYLFSVGRASSDDFDHAGRRVYNSQTGSDDADLNMQYQRGSVKWNGRLQYLRETGGLQKSPVYFDRTTRRIRVGQHGRWTLSGLSHLNADFVYDYTAHGVKNSTNGRSAQYHRGGAGISYQALFGEMNDFTVAASVLYQGLAVPGPDSDEFRAEISALDEFMLFSVLDVSAGFGMLYSDRPLVCLLPALKISWLVADSLRWTFFGKIVRNDELFPDLISACPWMNVPRRFAPVSAELSAGTGLETLVLGRIPLTLEAFYASDARRAEFVTDSVGLYRTRSRNADSIGARFDAVLTRVKAFDLRFDYGFRLFETTIGHMPMHSAGLRLGWEPNRMSFRLSMDYRTGFTSGGRMQKDLFDTMFEARVDVSENMGVFLSVENAAGFGAGLYPPYLEKGVVGMIGLRVNLL